MVRKPEIYANAFSNKETAFTRAEREQHGLIGLLPSAVETLELQATRAYAQFKRFNSRIEQYFYLDALHNRNETLYYKLLVDHIQEMFPVVYDPTIGQAIKEWSQNYRSSRAVYLSINNPEDIETAFKNTGLSAQDVDLIVCSDAEQILGIGDWGVNGTDISVGKLAVYTAAAGIDPRRVIAVNLDVGTDNQDLFADPLYLGNRHARVRGQAYDDFIDAYVKTASRLFPNALLHFEDFGAGNARRILMKYRDSYRVFNDDMQGTGAVVMSAVTSGLKVTKQGFKEQRLVVYGAGTAGTGMADQISAAMQREGLTREQAKSLVYLIDKNGLVTTDMPNLPNYQQEYARDPDEVASWKNAEGKIGLLEVINQVKPTILIGTSTHHLAFTEQVVKAMCAGVERPIILPLSNPDEKIEAFPADIIPWSEGKALVCTGIPVDPVPYKGVDYHIGQGNNALIYPGLGLGVIISKANKVTDAMLQAAAQALADQVNPTELGHALLPPVSRLREVSAIVAAAVAAQAQAEGVAQVSANDWLETAKQAMWHPTYA
ncbi:NAD-dependent malic enzyme [Psittacicella hinzii]|uniref:NAD-dependent malic enzyme n=1 Tax=Psittacicella hinzii TaxID=2028575 RepID=A0A3A1YPZ8_9GAMM|nr:NAD-dependent malic enzyme [Psittacicella hinzii]RIY39288.1 NAD-dependent malic enzyme [Psittacicella hinzii]